MLVLPKTILKHIPSISRTLPNHDRAVGRVTKLTNPMISEDKPGGDLCVLVTQTQICS